MKSSARHARNPGKRVAVPESRRKQAKAKKSEKTKWFLKKAKETKPKQTKAKKANTKRNTNTKTIVYPVGGGLYAHAREGTPCQSEAVAYYCRHINPTPSGYSLQALERFEGILGAEVTIHAIQIAQDERKQSWNYIKAILERYEREGVRSLADIQASEQQHQAARQQQGRKAAKAPVPEADRQPEDQAEFAARIAEQDAWMRDFLESQREEEG